jgi:hypothetical protein
MVGELLEYSWCRPLLLLLLLLESDPAAGSVAL